MTAHEIVKELILYEQSYVLNELLRVNESMWDTIANTEEYNEIFEWWLINIPDMNKEMNRDTFVPTREIREYDMKLRESIRQREQLKHDLAELEKRKKDIFRDMEYAMLSTGIKYFNTCSEYWLVKVESEYIKAEKEYQTD